MNHTEKYRICFPEKAPVLIVDGNPARVCNICGALVLRPSLHVDWHDVSETLIQ